MAIKIEKASKVYTCCGKYYAVSKDCEKSKIKCNQCGATLTGALRVPIIQIVTKS